MRQRKWIMFAFIASVLIGLQACAPKSQDDCGFVQNVYGERISWKDQLPVKMYVHQTVPDNFIPAIQAAARSWNDVAGKTVIEIVTDQKISGTPVGRDRMNVISFASTWEPDKLSEQAKTSVSWVGDLIQEADIKVNASKKTNGEVVFGYYWDKPADNSVNIEALVLHEMGHVLGLKHKDQGNSVMATYLASNTDRVHLADTDKTSLQCEY